MSLADKLHVYATGMVISLFHAQFVSRHSELTQALFPNPS